MLLISPFLFIFIGYPINSKRTIFYSNGILSMRCYHLGNTKEFFSCFKNHPRTNPIELGGKVMKDLNDLQQGFGYILIIFLLLQITLVPKLLNDV